MASNNRLQELLDELGMSAAEFSKATGLPKSSISMYLNGKRTMRQDKIGIIADRFNIDPAWLMGFQVPMNRDIDHFKNTYVPAMNANIERKQRFGATMTQDEIDMVESYRALDDLGQQMVMKSIEHETKRVKQIEDAKSESYSSTTLAAAHEMEEPISDCEDRDAEMLRGESNK